MFEQVNRELLGNLESFLVYCIGSTRASHVMNDVQAKGPSPDEPWTNVRLLVDA